MKSKYLFSLFFSLLLIQCFSQTNVLIIHPAQFSLTSDRLYISARVSSSVEINSIIARVGNKQINLTANTYNYEFDGSLFLDPDKEGDTLDLKVTATDYLGNQKTDIRKIVYDNPPKVTYLEPLNGFVANQTVHLNLKNYDIDTCTLNVFASYANGSSRTLLYSGKLKDSLERDFDWSSYPSNMRLMSIDVADNREQHTWRDMTLYRITPENGQQLKLFYKNRYIITDFQKNRIMGFEDSMRTPTIINTTNNTKEIIPLSGQVSKSFLTHYGAFLQTPDRIIYEWNTKNLDSLGKINSEVKANDHYAIWSDMTNLYFRDLSTKKDTILSMRAGNINNSLAEDGTVAYWGDHYNIFTYKNGITTKLTNNDDGKWNVYPVTDGNYVVYKKSSPCCVNQTYSIYLNDGIRNILLSDFGTTDIPSNAYACVNKFVAFCKLDALNRLQVYLRDSSGEVKPLTHFGSDSYVNNLNSKGDAIIYNYNNGDGSLYLFPKDGPMQLLLGGANLSTYYYDSTWYIVVGNSVFSMMPSSTLPLNLLSFTASQKGKFNELRWQTANELKTSSFIIERGGNTANFDSIGTVIASGNSASSKEYSFIDNRPLDGVIAYYRLRMEDKDGKYRLSAIRIVNNASTNFSIKLYPNPVANHLNVTCQLDKKQKVTFTIFDAGGNKLSSIEMVLDKGASLKAIDVKKLTKGFYFLSAKSNTGNQTLIKFAK